MSEPVKYTVDVMAAGITGAALLQLLPSITAGATLVWVLIRIWESRTVRRLVKRITKD